VESRVRRTQRCVISSAEQGILYRRSEDGAADKGFGDDGNDLCQIGTDVGDLRLGQR
jgi:hypothetical protein